MIIVVAIGGGIDLDGCWQHTSRVPNSVCQLTLWRSIEIPAAW
ncbi:MAG: hypothetical protein AB4040_11005 [Synechococcus sp.]